MSWISNYHSLKTGANEIDAVTTQISLVSDERRPLDRAIPREKDKIRQYNTSLKAKGGDKLNKTTPSDKQTHSPLTNPTLDVASRNDGDTQSEVKE